MQQILIDFLKSPNNIDIIRTETNIFFKNAFSKYLLLHSQLLSKEINVEYLNEVKIYFYTNQVFIDNLLVSDKYLKKYVFLVHKFWKSYCFHTGNMITVPKFNLFDEIEKELQNSNPKFGYILQQSAVMRKNLEESWIASNQVLTKYEISLLSN